LSTRMARPRPGNVKKAKEHRCPFAFNLHAVRPAG
jgi:hypothetical protein